MRILTYVFETSLTFSKPVSDHSFVLRCLPKSTNTQTVMDAQIFTFPRVVLTEQQDGFGNRIVVGYMPEEHDSFNFYTTGQVQTVMDAQIFTFPRVVLTEQQDGFGNRIVVGYMPEEHDSFNFYTTGQVMVACDLAGETPCHPMFLQPTRLTACTEEMARFAKEVVAGAGLTPSDGEGMPAKGEADGLGVNVEIALADIDGEGTVSAVLQAGIEGDAPDVLAQARALCGAVHARFSYVPGATSVSTTAAEAFYCETGVCQDYAQVMIALCRSVGIPARYVTFSYVPGATSVSTTAAEAFYCETGVCQDYAQVMIALCRSVGIPARYVTGLMVGHGATHAWVEVHDGRRWHGFDPTNNTEVDDRYMLFATGRDFEDCPIERGIFRGAAEQTQEISASLGDATSQNEPEDDRYMLFATGRDFEDCPIERGIFRGAAEQTQEISASLGDATSQNEPDQLLTF